jgi:alpha-galactosidase
MSFIDVLRAPDFVAVHDDSTRHKLDRTANAWGHDDIEVRTPIDSETLCVELAAPQSAVQWIQLRWHATLSDGLRFLGDHWERSYADMEWRGLVPERVMPWYFLVHDGQLTHGYGVRTGAHSIAFWRADSQGISLFLDVRNGGSGVQLGNRVLVAAHVVSREGSEGESPFQAAQAFCRAMCDEPLMPSQPVYGGNDWYYAYSNNSHQTIVRDSEAIASWAPAGGNRPFMVIDDGWQICNRPSNGGPWHEGNRNFSDMPGLAAEMKQIGVRPGIWMRPLLTSERVPESWRFPRGRPGEDSGDQPLDPSVPEVLEHVRNDIRRLAGWGYDLIKHDFSTFDIFGQWGVNMRTQMTNNGWHFADRSKTSAEIVLDLYRAIREAAGSTLVIGCNTIGHLAAGLVELQRTGDDTSGRNWERTRRYGINTLAFRMAQHGTFFAVDADCVGLTNQVPWHFNKQWLDLLARSGTPLFVSAAPDAVGAEQRAALRQAFAFAAQEQPIGEPLDWMSTVCPSRWKLRGETVEFDWFGDEGVFGNAGL